MSDSVSPDGWTSLRLEQLGTIFTGATPPTNSSKNYNGEIPFIGPSDLGKKRWISSYSTSLTHEGAKYTRLAKHGDILVSCIGMLGKVSQVSETSGFNQQINCIAPFGDFDRGFLYFACCQLEAELNKVAGLQVLPIVKKSLFSAISINLPKDPQEQSKIAAILTSIDTAIEKTEALIEKYRQIKAGLMHDLFTRGVLPNGQLRRPRTQAPELYQETEIGWIPKDWEISGLAIKGRSGASWIRTGPFGSSLKGEHWRNHGHPVITIGSLGEGVFTSEELLFVNSKDAARLIDFQLKPGDVVFSRVADVGRSVVVREEQTGWIMSSNLMRISVDETKVRPDFLQMALANDVRVKAQIRTRVNSGGRDVANSDVLSKLKFVWPDVAEQDRIIAASKLASRRLESEQHKAAKLQIKKLGLMQDLLTGKVPVKVDDSIAEVASG